MSFQIDELYEVKSIDQLTDLFLDAFQEYPKLRFAFQNSETRKTALEATFRFYGAYDLKYGKAYSLDSKVNEAAVLIESSQVRYTFLRHLLAGSYSKAYRKTMKKFRPDEKQTLTQMFSELDQLERQLTFPKKHIYLDFIGVKTELQGKGHGKKLMEHICHYSDQCSLPLMLFTNTQQDIEFYHKIGFEVVGTTHSDKFGFTNTYMVRDASPS